MSKRYFKSTDQTITIFRATERTAGYAYGVFSGGRGAFSNHHQIGARPAFEITKVEYDALVAAKNARLVAAGREPRGYTQPYHSWVCNDQIGA
jgi:hypothetical protein